MVRFGCRGALRIVQNCSKAGVGTVGLFCGRFRVALRQLTSVVIK